MALSRELPEDLVVRLQRTRELERLAETHEQYTRAVYATTTLIAAARDAGWLLTDLAKPLNMSADAASKRIRDARREGRLHPAGLVVDTPAEIHLPLDEFKTPVEERDWLTRTEAAGYLGVASRTVHGYLKRGLLPHTRRVGLKWNAYLRADLEALRRSPTAPQRVRQGQGSRTG